MKDLKALRYVNFDWVTRLDSVWAESAFDVPRLNRPVRTEILAQSELLGQATDTTNPLGITVVGAAGAGKTHLLGTLRRTAAGRGEGFVLVDMTDVRDFWETVLLGYLGSIQQPFADGRSQLVMLLAQLLQTLRPKEDPYDVLDILDKAPQGLLIKNIDRVIGGLHQKYRPQIRAHQDVVRALFLLNSPHIEISNLGYSWLQGIALEERAHAAFHFAAPSKRPMEIVEGLSWIFSLRSPVILALDQLDAIVTQHHMVSEADAEGDLADAQLASLSIIEGIGGGLSALVRGIAKRTQVVVACLESTWEILRHKALKSDTDSYTAPMGLRPIDSGDVARKMIEARLGPAFRKAGFDAPYPSWPFLPEAFERTRGLFPRDLLRICDTHRKLCLQREQVTELSDFGKQGPAPEPSKASADDPWQDLDARFAGFRKEAPLGALLDENNEDEILATLLQTACWCLIKENPLSGDVDAVVDVDFGGGRRYPPLHSRIRLIDRGQSDLENHYCLRAIEKRNAVAFQARLKAAMTAAGIDRNLGFRRLVVFRTVDPPGGAVTQRLVEKFLKAKGRFVAPDPRELAALWAVQQMRDKREADFEDWLMVRRPISCLEMMKQARLVKDSRMAEGQNADAQKPAVVAQLTAGRAPSKSRPKTDAALAKGQLLLGYPDVQGPNRAPLCMDPGLMVKHVLALAGSGSGKTVLVRRLVEEAALLGIPAIVIDGANDLARLGDPWPQRPASWTDGDARKAADYHKQTEVVIWTPGREKGNPLSLEALPDLAAVADDVDELNLAVGMAVESFREFVAPGNSVGARKKIGVLSAALENFARSGGGTFEEFLGYLSDLPTHATAGIGDAPKLAGQIADSIRAAVQINPLLRQSGTALDAGVLFGEGRRGKAARISVINFVGLPNLVNQQQFLNQLAMTLFSWIKKHPAAKGRPIRGLLVIDEAKDFVPSVKSAPCKMSLMRLAAQARKYGLGLIFATQSPRDIDNTIITNCTTHYYGKASSPNAIKVIAEQIRSRGGTGDDIPRLETGQFYVFTEGLPVPVTVRVPLCLSHHPANPLNEMALLERALKTKALV